jgi:hypothetical protein
MIHGRRVLLFLRLQGYLTKGFREHSDTGFAYTQHPPIRNGAPGDVPDLRTHTHIGSSSDDGTTEFDAGRSPCQSQSIELDAATGGLCKITE